MGGVLQALAGHPLIALSAIACAVCAAVCFSRFLGVNRAKKSNAGSLILEISERERSAGVQRSESFTVGRELEGTEKRLYDAGIDMSVSTFATLRLVVAAFAAVLAAVAGLGPLAVAFAAAGYIAPGMAVARKAKGRAALLERQLAQAETQIAENSRAGLSVERSIKTCMQQMDNPLRDQFERLYNEISFSNTTLVEAFDNMAKRTGSPDVKLLSQVIAVQQETGANLAVTLDFLSDTISKKMEMRRKLRGKVSETKVTKYVVSFAPLLILLICSATVSGFSEFYMTNPVGWALLAASAAWMAMGLRLLSKIADVDVE